MLVTNELLNTYGNLLGRSTGTAINPRQVFPTSNTLSKFDTTESKRIEDDLKALPDMCATNYSNGYFFHPIEEMMRITRSINNIYQSSKPWTLVKLGSEREKWEWIQFITMESLRITSILLQPIIPMAARKSLDRLGIPEKERTWNHTKYNREKSRETPLGRNTGPLFRKVT